VAVLAAALLSYQSHNPALTTIPSRPEPLSLLVMPEAMLQSGAYTSLTAEWQPKGKLKQRGKRHAGAYLQAEDNAAIPNDPAAFSESSGPATLSR
jgi:hypothetical protein